MTTIRNRLTEVASYFDKVEVALFTSFNFNGDFFEENVLPALFCLDEKSSRRARVQEIHKALTKTSVGVFYDPSVAKPSGKAYRYTHYPVFLSGRLFHAKNIFLIGLDENGNRWLYIATLSGNLSLSGWGKNCEVIADTWVHASKEQPWQAVSDYFNWLKSEKFSRQKRNSHPLEQAIRLMSDGMNERCSRSDPEGDKWEKKQDIRLYFSPLYDSFWDFVFESIGEVDQLEVASPYWGTANKCLARLRSVAGLKASSEIKFVLAKIQPLMKLGLGKDEFEQIGRSWKHVEWQIWKDIPGRFHHLKLYRFFNEHGIWSAVGSCNFSEPGLSWKYGNKGEFVSGNVESMMLRENDGLNWKSEKMDCSLLPEKSTADDAPEPWTFFVSVSYDWSKNEYQWQVEGSVKGLDAIVRTSGIEIKLNENNTEGSRKGTLTSTIYRINLPHHKTELIGSIIELNLEESTREYYAPLSSEIILHSWLQGAIDEPMPAPEEVDVNDEEQVLVQTKILESQVNAVHFFDFFDFYRAAREFERKALQLARKKNMEDALLDFLLRRTDSLSAMSLAITKSSYSNAVKLLVTLECSLILEKVVSENPVIKRQTKHLLIRFKNEIDQVREHLKTELRKDEQLLKKPDINIDKLMDWYERNLRRVT